MGFPCRGGIYDASPSRRLYELEAVIAGSINAPQAHKSNPYYKGVKDEAKKLFGINSGYIICLAVFLFCFSRRETQTFHYHQHPELRTP
jgi:hypothetical protein